MGEPIPLELTRQPVDRRGIPLGARSEPLDLAGELVGPSLGPLGGRLGAGAATNGIGDLPPKLAALEAELIDVRLLLRLALAIGTHPFGLVRPLARPARSAPRLLGSFRPGHEIPVRHETHSAEPMHSV